MKCYVFLCEIGWSSEESFASLQGRQVDGDFFSWLAHRGHKPLRRNSGTPGKTKTQRTQDRRPPWRRRGRPRYGASRRPMPANDGSADSQHTAPPRPGRTRAEEGVEAEHRRPKWILHCKVKPPVNHAPLESVEVTLMTASTSTNAHRRRLIQLEGDRLSVSPVGHRPRLHGARRYGRRIGRRRRRLGLVALLVPPVDPRLAAAGRHGLDQYVGKVRAQYRRGIGLQSAAMAERRAGGGCGGRRRPLKVEWRET